LLLLEAKVVSIQINIGDHVSPFKPFLQPIPFRHQWVTSWARRRAKVIAATVKGADTYFKSLPGKRSLTQLLSDRTIWINYASELAALGARPGNSNEIGIGELAYLRGKLMVLATLIHELAHINGAPDGESRAAEDAVLHCGLGKQSERDTGVNDPRTPYDPDERG
jgi:hypothetical protein